MAEATAEIVGRSGQLFVEVRVERADVITLASCMRRALDMMFLPRCKNAGQHFSVRQ